MSSGSIGVLRGAPRCTARSTDSESTAANCVGSFGSRSRGARRVKALELDEASLRLPAQLRRRPRSLGIELPASADLSLASPQCLVPPQRDFDSVTDHSNPGCGVLGGANQAADSPGVWSTCDDPTLRSDEIHRSCRVLKAPVGVCGGPIVGAGDENRTRVLSLGSGCSAAERRPQMLLENQGSLVRSMCRARFGARDTPKAARYLSHFGLSPSRTPATRPGRSCSGTGCSTNRAAAR